MVFGRGTKVPRIIGVGVSKSLGYLVGGTKVPRKFGMGGSKFLGYRPGVPNFLGYLVWGYQNS